MDAAAHGVAEEQDDEHGIDQQDVLYRMVLFLATVTVRLFSRVLGADNAPFRREQKGGVQRLLQRRECPLRDSQPVRQSREGAGGSIAEAAQRCEQRRQQDNWLALLWLMPNSRPWTT